MYFNNKHYLDFSGDVRSYKEVTGSIKLVYVIFCYIAFPPFAFLSLYLNGEKGREKVSPGIN